MNQSLAVGGLMALVLASGLLDYGRESNPVLTRLTWGMVICGVLLAATIANPWVGLLVGLVCLNIWRHEQPSEITRVHLFPALALVGVYAALAPHMRPSMVEPILWAFVAVVTVTGLWATYSLIHRPSKTEGYEHSWMVRGWRVHVYEFSRLEAGHANPNHTQCLAALGLAAGVGLVHVGQWGAAYCLPFLAMPILAVQWENRVGDDGKRPGPTQGLVHVAVLGLGAVILAVGWIGWLLALGVVLTAFWQLSGYSGGRLAVWRNMVWEYWWRQGWDAKLLGTGTGSWVHLHLAWVHAQDPKDKPVLFTVAHNEFIQHFVEFGMIGAMVLVGYCVSAITGLVQGGPEGEAVFLVGMVMLSIASLHFPWALYHEIVVDPLTGRKHGHGSPTLLYWTLVIALLIEGIER